jgi:hypothetical protein
MPTFPPWRCRQQFPSEHCLHSAISHNTAVLTSRSRSVVRFRCELLTVLFVIVLCLSFCIPLYSSSYIRYLVHYLPVVTVTVRGGPRLAPRNWFLRRTMNFASFGSLIWYFPSNLAFPPDAYFTVWTGHPVYVQSTPLTAPQLVCTFYAGFTTRDRDEEANACVMYTVAFV